ncbi:hypothetical protein GYMLUDRAFT_39485 [Collybiopsis luxurians FD-317 M1]|nr:hypothetical protein GYMLUDRAFT_39485 [Collybiopsis luxurians FD-317 M1]
MVQSNSNRTSDVLTSRGTDPLQPPPTHDHAREALRLALGSILTPKRSTSNPGSTRSSSSSGTASPAHFQFPYGVGSHTPLSANPSSPVPQGHASHGHLPFPHPHAHQHLHHPHGPSHLVPGREHVPGHLSSSSSTSTTHSPPSSIPASPVAESISSSSPFNHYPRPGLVSRSISSSSVHSTSGRSPAVGGGKGNNTTESSVPPPSPHSAAASSNAGSGASAAAAPNVEGIHAPTPRIPVNSDSSSNTGALPPIPAVAVTTPGGTPISSKNKFIKTLEGKTASAWDALIHGSFS